MTPDDDKKIKYIRVTYTKPDKTTGIREIRLTESEKLGAFSLDVPETGKDGDGTHLINNFYGQALEVLAGSKLVYEVTFISKNSSSLNVVDLIWEGEGSGSIASGSKTTGTGGDDMDADDFWTEEELTIKVKAEDGYKVADKLITFTYTEENGNSGKWSREATDQMRIYVKTLKDGRVLVIFSNEKRVWIKKGTTVEGSVRFIGKYRISVIQGGNSNGNDNDKITFHDEYQGIDPKKITPNTDGTYTQLIEVTPENQTSPVYGTVKIFDLNGEMGTTSHKDGEVLRAAYEDRIAISAKAAEGYKLLKLLLVFMGTDNQGNPVQRRQQIVTVDDSIIDPDGGTTYLFYMPEADARIVAVFPEPKAAGETDPPEEPKKTASGKTVGVGAGFAMTYSKVDVTAGIGKNRTVSAGTADIRADSIHNTQTAAVAGTDPLAASSGGKQTETQKDVSIDASAALTIISDSIRTVIEEERSS